MYFNYLLVYNKKMLLIDFREREFINNLAKYVEIKNDQETSIKINNINIVFKVLSLPIGDFIIEKNNSPCLIIERKTLTDLSASIIDGRFREQKARLLDSIGDPNKILYIIENNVGKMSISKDIMESAIINLIFKHNYKMLRTGSNDDTFNNVLLLYKKIQGNEFVGNNDIKDTCRMITKGGKMRQNIFINQLCLIPGVSEAIAKVINDKYMTMNNLINEWNKIEDIVGKEKMLIDLQITEKRKIGKALSKKIYDAHF